MQAFLDCIPCILQQGLRTARLVTDDEEAPRQVLTQLLSELTQADLAATPMELGYLAQRVVREVAGCHDPYSAIKEESNAQALRLYPRLKEIVAVADDPLQIATKIAIAGNIIDFGVPEVTLDVEATIDRVLKSPFAVDHYELFADRIAQASTLLYLADNAGEIVFDRVLIEQIPAEHIVVAVKNEPFINDATMADAQVSGLTEQVEVIAAPIYPATTPELQAVWDGAQLIIAKGQANYEAYSTAEGPLFFLLLAKCDFVAQDLGVNNGDMILKSRNHRLPEPEEQGESS